LKLLIGSILLGFLSGFVFSAMIPIFRVRRRGALESTYIFVSAYACFALGEFLNMSGIIVVLFGGLVMGVYAREYLDDNHSVDITLFNAARAADMVMFIIIGFCFFLADSLDGFKLGLLTIVFCLISRVIMITMMVPVVNLIKRSRGYETINFGRAFMMFHSGLRGGMTMMMALMVDPYWSENQNTLVVATVTCVTGMAYLCGCTGPYFLKTMEVPMGVDQEDGSLFDEGSQASAFLGVVDTWVAYVIGLGAKQKEPRESIEEKEPRESVDTPAASSTSLTTD
jgi:NhaP-type Na+/H+ or K+/H+ antiporter